ncbi:hypothetical protein [Neobacillus cucumis]|uniref:hypothetical protein n=1 Tax=Neobacillus cucumis TaxID=1740721 RepID=UPI00115ADCF3|nr:hypothetical protein [Neobacillus cucumis]
MFKEKDALLHQYYELTNKLIMEINPESMENVQIALEERQKYIEKINFLDQKAEQILMNPEMKELLLRIEALEKILQERLKEAQQKVLSQIHSLKKEKRLKHYGDMGFVSSGIFYDKRK